MADESHVGITPSGDGRMLPLMCPGAKAHSENIFFAALKGRSSTTSSRCSKSILLTVLQGRSPPKIGLRQLENGHKFFDE